jgi:polar amino acid transport system permease protein
MRVIVPPTGNEVLSMMKNTSLVAAVPFSELTFTAQTIYASTYKIIPMLVMACLWYLLLSSVLMIAQYYIERYFSRGVGKGASPRRQRVRFRGGGGGQ